jgi:hypothetical protein
MLRKINPWYAALSLLLVLGLIGPYAAQAAVLTLALAIFLGTVGLQRPAGGSGSGLRPVDAIKSSDLAATD